MNIKKKDVLHFILQNIPEPDSRVSWEQIIEFRSDLDARNKYLALTHWINRVSASSISLSDIKEEYEYLYNDYVKHLKLHKLKYNTSLLEVFVTAGIGVLTGFQAGEFIPSLKNLLQIRLANVNLLKEEAQLPGKEVAYIYHLKKKFENQ